MITTNNFRSKAFIKIKHCIVNSENENHLECCKQMLDNAYSILMRDEIIILNEYVREKEQKFISDYRNLTEYAEKNNPYIWENPIETEIHKRECGAH